MTSHGHAVNCVEIVDYTGPPPSIDACFDTKAVALDIQTYTLKPEHEIQTRRMIKQADGVKSNARIIPLPSILLKDEWNSLIFEDALPSRLLRYLVCSTGARMAVSRYRFLISILDPHGSNNEAVRSEH